MTKVWIQAEYETDNEAIPNPGVIGKALSKLLSVEEPVRVEVHLVRRQKNEV